MPTGIYKRTAIMQENMSKALIGRTLSPEHKEKLYQILLEKHRNGLSPVLGKRWKWSVEARNNHVKSAPRGEKCWNWKDGITPENKRIRNSSEFKLWREFVFARDNWTCQKYGIRGQKGIHVELHPHHIQNFAQFSKLRFAIDNGITLSKEAHQEFHEIYGEENNTREQLEEFL